MELTSQAVEPSLPLPSPKRLGVVLFGIGLTIVALVGRVAYLQTAFAKEAADRAERQHKGSVGVAARRGGIFDRNGLMLAGTVQTKSVFADPWFMHQQYEKTGNSWFQFDVALERLAEAVRADPDRVALAIGRDPDKRYVPLARGLSETEADAVVQLAASMQLRGIATEPEPRRLYPMGKTAAHVLGAVGRDGVGLEGIERKRDDHLSGQDGRIVTVRDKRRRSIAAELHGYRPPRHGSGVVLTLDSTIQLIAEQELADTCRAFGAEGGSVVVMDPKTGDVLALANYPSYYPQYLTDSTPDARRNRAIVDPYEPGSVVKPLLMAGLLEAGLVRLDEVLETGKTHRLPVGRRVTDFHAYDELAVWDVLVKSSNIGMAKLSTRTDYYTLTDIYRRFGLGEETGLALDGESAGLIYKDPPDAYTASSISFGYALMVTPVQMARAMSAIANHGQLPSPRIIAGEVGPDGEFVLNDNRRQSREAVSPAIADKIRRVLADGFVRGTVRHARSEKWNLFGKTGTAHQSVNGQQSNEKYFASFVGGGPYEAPRLVIAVAINEPDKEKGHQGGQVAGGTAARILERSLTYLGVPHSPPLPEPPEFMRDLLYNYRSSEYEPNRTLTDDPIEDTNDYEAQE